MPEAVLVAVGKNSVGIFVGRQLKADFGAVFFAQAFAVAALVGFQINPADVLVAVHFVLALTNIDVHPFAVHRYFG